MNNDFLVHTAVIVDSNIAARNVAWWLMLIGMVVIGFYAIKNFSVIVVMLGTGKTTNLDCNPPKSILYYIIMLVIQGSIVYVLFECQRDEERLACYRASKYLSFFYGKHPLKKPILGDNVSYEFYKIEEFYRKECKE